MGGKLLSMDGFITEEFGMLFAYASIIICFMPNFFQPIQTKLSLLTNGCQIKI